MTEDELLNAMVLLRQECLLSARETIETLATIKSADAFSLALDLCSVALDEYKGMLTLLLQQNFCAAFALARPCIETSLRSIYLTRFAPPEKAALILGEIAEDHWPSLEGLIGTVSAMTKTSKWLPKKLPPRGFLNQLTHGSWFAAVNSGLRNDFPDLRFTLALQMVDAVEDLVLASVTNLAALNGSQEWVSAFVSSYNEVVMSTKRLLLPFVDTKMTEFKAFDVALKKARL